MGQSTAADIRFGDNTALDDLERRLRSALAAGRLAEAWDIYQNQIGSRHLAMRRGYYARGARLCRLLAGDCEPAEVLDRADASPARRTGPGDRFPLPQAVLWNDWGFFLSRLGQLDPAWRCFDAAITRARDANDKVNELICRQNLAELHVLTGRLPRACQEADQACRLAEGLPGGQAGDDIAFHGCCARTLRAHANALHGETRQAWDDFKAVLDPTRALEPVAMRPVGALAGVLQTLWFLRRGENQAAWERAEAGLATVAGCWGIDNHEAQKYRLIKAELLLRKAQAAPESRPGQLEKARALQQAAHAWAVQHEAGEILCWSALMDLRIRAAMPLDDAGWDALFRAANDAIAFARERGYGVYQVDLLLERAAMFLCRTEPWLALNDVRAALDVGGCGATPLNRWRVLPSRDPDCDYLWGTAQGLYLRARAFSILAARSVEISRLNADDRPTTNRFADQARVALRECLESYERLGNPQFWPTNQLEEDLDQIERWQVPAWAVNLRQATVPSEAPSITALPPPNRPRAVFVSYASSDDKHYLERLLVHLHGLVDPNETMVWCALDLQMGDEWHKQILGHLSQARVAVLLVSANFLSSEYIKEFEMPLLVATYKRGQLALCPILLSPCVVEHAKFEYVDDQGETRSFGIAEIQLVPGLKEKTVSELERPAQERVFRDVAIQVHGLLAGPPRSRRTAP